MTPTEVQSLIDRLERENERGKELSGTADRAAWCSRTWYLMGEAAAALREQQKEIARLEQLQSNNEGRIKEIVSDELLRRAERAEARIKQLESGYDTLRTALHRAEAERELQEISARKYRSERDAAIKRAEIAEGEVDLYAEQVDELKLPILFGAEHGRAWYEAVQESIDAAMKAIEAAKAMRLTHFHDTGGTCAACDGRKAFDAALAKLEQEQGR